MEYYRSYDYQKYYIKKYYQKNRETILEHKKQKVYCGCGSVIKIGNISKHQRTQKHQLFVNTLDICVGLG
jgi:hypothetical protein